MRKFKYWFLGGGIVVAAMGVISLPIGFGASPKRTTSIFNNIADTGAFFTSVTGALLIVGVFLILISSFIKDENAK